MALTKEEIFNIYQSNLTAAEEQLKIIEELCKEKRAFFYIYENNISNYKKVENEYNSCKRIYALLLGNWYEIILYKIIYDLSSAAFSETEINSINNNNNKQRRISEKWKLVYNISKDKAKRKFPMSALPDFSSYFCSDYFDEIDELITMRNRLSHGQWNIQLNSQNTNTKVLDFFKNYKTFAELKLLRNKLIKMAQIVETLVAVKDKTATTFKNKLQKLKNEIDSINKRITVVDDRKNAKDKIANIKKLIETNYRLD